MLFTRVPKLVKTSKEEDGMVLDPMYAEILETTFLFPKILGGSVTFPGTLIVG